MGKTNFFESLTLIVSTIVTAILVLGVVRYFAPQLLGLSSDIQLVQVSKKVPPFFEGVFRTSDYETDEYILPDPYIKRAKPLFPDLGGIGPNDILGFRNRNIPNVSDVIIIGDSQTYGNNARIETNWPNLFMKNLNSNKTTLITHYDIAVGGWGAIEYLEIFYKSLLFQPKTVIVAFYTGNDSLETFRLAYSNDRWSEYQVDKSLSLDDIPHVEFPPPKKDLWKVIYKDRVGTVFTPKNRLHSNEKSKVVQAGYDAMLLVAKEIARVCENNKISVIFTVIPTKELVYLDKTKREVNNLPEEYTVLVNNEQNYINWFGLELSKIPGAQYINIVKVLQKQALLPIAMYPADGNGHPIAAGYKVIADHLANEIELKWEVPEGLVALFTSESKYQLGLIRDNNYWLFANTDLIEQNGWDPSVIPITIKNRDIANLNKKGLITLVDKQQFGPR